MKKISRSSGLQRMRAPRALLSLVVVVVLVFIVVAALLWRGAAAGLLWRILAPVTLWRNDADFSEITQLQVQLASTTAALADRNLLYQENLDLKARLDRDGVEETVLAGILLRPPGTPYDTLMVDAGAAQGIVVGDQVSAGGEAFIGTVEQVYPTTARVVLFSAPGQNFNALLTQEDGSVVPINVVGQGGGSMVATVPANTIAMVGDPVVFPGINGGFSGSISAVVTKEGDSFETLYLSLPADPLTLRFVEIRK
jgi:cell shape-determining protein MreC